MSERQIARRALPIALAAFSVAAAAATNLDLRPIAVFSQHLYAGNLNSPRGIAVDSAHGEVWVVDTQNRMLGVFSREGTPLFAFRSEKRLREPMKVAIDPKGNLLVLDGDRKAISRFSYRGQFLGELALPGTGDSPSFGAVACDRNGMLYVGENNSGQILVYDAELRLKRRFGSRGEGEGEFQSIAAIAVDDEAIFVLDHQVTAVQMFDHRGDFVRGWGAHEMGAEHFSLPEGIALDSKGHVIVVDALRHEIKFFDREGKFLGRFGGMGKRVGNVNFPCDVAVDSEDRVYVVDRGNSRIQVFELITK